MSRPSILTDQLRAHIEPELATGATQAVASQRTGVKARSLQRWLAEGKVTRHWIEPEPELPSPLEHTEPEVVAVIIAAAPRGSWQAAAWVLERRWPERWLKPTHRPVDPPTDDDKALAEIIGLARRRKR